MSRRGGRKLRLRLWLGHRVVGTRRFRSRTLRRLAAWAFRLSRHLP